MSDVGCDVTALELGAELATLLVSVSERLSGLVEAALEAAPVLETVAELLDDGELAVLVEVEPEADV